MVGAESTGKTTLARALRDALAARSADSAQSAQSARFTPSAHSALSGQSALSATSPARIALVPETLREWCEATGRTPRADEQRQILDLQHQRIDAAAHTHDVVVCDTTALMTAVYSRFVFGDRTLEATAVALHRRIRTTLLTALDLPWVADGHQRDGAFVREPVDALLRGLLAEHAIDFAVIGGSGPARLAQAEAALGAAWPRAAPSVTAALEGPTGAADPIPAGLFSRLQAGGEAQTPWRTWTCDCCVPQAERTLFKARLRRAG